MNARTRTQMRDTLGEVFTPATPIEKRSLFAGRVSQIETLIKTLNEKGCHTVIYGERGVGKTSFANMIAEASGANLYVSKTSCDSSDTFDSIWRKAFRRITLPYKKPTLGLVSKENIERVALEELLPKDHSITPGDVVRALEFALNVPTIIVFDEFDRVRDDDTRRLLADTIKAVSDNLTGVKLIVVGVAGDVTSLIGEHQSIERSIRQIFLPRMAPQELAEIIDKGFNKLNMSIKEGVKTKIVRFSQGFPHYTHLLAKSAAQAALDDDRTLVQDDDLDKAVSGAVREAQESLRNAYQKATIAAKKTIFPEVLLACALAPVDEHGNFRAADLEKALSTITKRNYITPQFAYHLAELCSAARGSILIKVGEGKRFRYRFTNPLFKPYVILHAYDTGLLKHARSYKAMMALFSW